MITLLSPHYVFQATTDNEMVVASLAWGFTLGFGWLTTWTAMKQTIRIYKRHGLCVFHNAYVWMIWLEILVCLILSIICWLHLRGVISPSFAVYFCIVTAWALQIQLLPQIIINRCCLLLMDQKKTCYLKASVAALITAMNISVYTIWIPARLQISERYIWINSWWDYCEKGIYLLVDAALNFYFIHIIRTDLLKSGLTKYKALVKFNVNIIGISLGMDVLLISTMSLRNTLVYMQFHPLVYMVKLNIEMSMADLIAKVARTSSCGIIAAGSFGDIEGGEMTQNVSSSFS